MSVVHRVRLPIGAVPLVEVGHRVEPAEVLATRRPPGEGRSIAVAAPLRRSPALGEACVLVRPGTMVEAGEALARQFVAGKRFFMEQLGVEPLEAWLPDTFGYSGALPQIVRAAGSRWWPRYRSSPATGGPSA